MTYSAATDDADTIARAKAVLKLLRDFGADKDEALSILEFAVALAIGRVDDSDGSYTSSFVDRMCAIGDRIDRGEKWPQIRAAKRPKRKP